MNKQQPDWFSIKNAIEHTVQGYIASFTNSVLTDEDCSEGFGDSVMRYIATLYVSGQIKNDYLVAHRNTLEITYTVDTRCSRLTFILPYNLQRVLKVRKAAPPVAEDRPGPGKAIVDEVLAVVDAVTEAASDRQIFYVDVDLATITEINRASAQVKKEQHNCWPFPTGTTSTKLIVAEATARDADKAYDRAMKFIE